jgi:uncharacterized protein (DUF924 family)
MTQIQEILDFWFHPKNHPDYGQNRMEWFKKDPGFDAEITARFKELFHKGTRGELLSWCETSDGCMALILLFDQFSRNMFRGDGTSFSADGKAREIARHMQKSGFYPALPNFMKSFAALPFEHSEDLDDQNLAVSLFEEIGEEQGLLYAIKHKEIIEKFGRFPHRNDLLRRISTTEEKTFLGQPGSSF